MQPSTLFAYGILKRGFQLDLTKRGAKFLGEAQLPGAILYRIGYGGVGLRLVEDPSKVAFGEVFEIPDILNPLEHPVYDRKLWRWLDEIENNGLAYTRKVVKVTRTFLGGVPVNELTDEGIVPMTLDAWVYEHSYPGARYDKPIESGRYEYVKGY